MINWLFCYVCNKDVARSSWSLYKAIKFREAAHRVQIVWSMTLTTRITGQSETLATHRNKCYISLPPQLLRRPLWSIQFNGALVQYSCHISPRNNFRHWFDVIRYWWPISIVTRLLLHVSSSRNSFVRGCVRNEMRFKLDSGEIVSK